MANWGTAPWTWTSGVDNATIAGLGAGVDLTIDVSTAASGNLDFLGGTQLDDATSFAGGISDLLVGFFPDSGQGTSPVTITASFSKPVYNLSFLISDIDGTSGNRRDQVTVMSDAGAPTLGIVTTGTPTFAISGNQAQALNSTLGSNNNDLGTVLATFPEGVTTVTITYEETSGDDNARGRIIGLFGDLSFCMGDADGDGIPNHLDLDSDNDGCPDVVEAGHTDPDVDGVVGTGTPSVDIGGQVIGITYPSPAPSAVTDASQNLACCDVTISGFPDNDSDGVADFCDLDDDNDGILVLMRVIHLS